MQVLSILRWMKNETKQTNTHTRQPHAPNLLQWIANVLNAGNGADGSKILNRAPCRKELSALVMFRKLLNVCHARSPFSHINKCYFWPKHRLRLEHHSTQWLNTITEQKSVFLILDLAVFVPPSLTFWDSSDRLVWVDFFIYSLLPKSKWFRLKYIWELSNYLGHVKKT